MDFRRCENGHYYDAERFDSCPHCSQNTISTVAQDDDGGSLYTVPMNEGFNNSGAGNIGVELHTDDIVHTIGYFGEVETEPVVGWLVAIEGAHQGMDFKLKTGRNFIGRSTDMDVALTGDASISRDRHAIILYEPKGNVFLVQPGDAKELFYLNEKVVLAAVEINAYDVLSLGNSKLLFIPCCSDKFNWDSVKKKEEQK